MTSSGQRCDAKGGDEEKSNDAPRTGPNAGATGIDDAIASEDGATIRRRVIATGGAETKGGTSSVQEEERLSGLVHRRRELERKLRRTRAELDRRRDGSPSSSSGAPGAVLADCDDDDWIRTKSRGKTRARAQVSAAPGAVQIDENNDDWIRTKTRGKKTRDEMTGEKPVEAVFKDDGSEIVGMTNLDRTSTGCKTVASEVDLYNQEEEQKSDEEWNDAPNDRDGSGEIGSGGSGSRGLGPGRGLAVATAVPPDEIDNIPAAVQCEPPPIAHEDPADTKARLHGRKRFCGYAAVGFVLLVGIAVGVSVALSRASSSGDDNGPDASTDPPSAPPTQAPTPPSKRSMFASRISQIEGVDRSMLDDESTPQSKALDWIVDDDPLSLEIGHPNLERRFVLASLYFSTVNMGSNWTACGYSGDPTDISCTVTDEGDSIAWLSATDECHWYNVLCENNGTDVITIDLQNNNLNGTLPDELHTLRGLEFFVFHSNQLRGTVPTYFGKLTKLKTFELHNNDLVGTIPEELYELKLLRKFNLGANDLGGTISTRLGDLVELGGLFLFENSLTGTVPTEIGRLEFLEFLRIQDNALNWTLPTEIGKLGSARLIYMYNNNLRGSLPSQIRGLTSLTNLRVQAQTLSGALPDSLYSLTDLKYLYLQNNKFTGTINTMVGKLTKATRLIFSNNFFNGTIPTELAKVADMEYLWLQEQHFSGSVPDSLYSLTDLESLYVRNNKLTGTISTMVGKLTKARTLRFSNNLLNGTIPTELAKLADMEDLWLHSNDFSGQLPDSVCNLKNSTGKLSNLRSDCNPTNTTGPPAVVCNCCSHCCDSFTGECNSCVGIPPCS